MAYQNIPGTRPEPLHLAVIGTGWIGAFHARTVTDYLPDAVLHVVADPAEGRAAALAAELGCPNATERIEDVFEDERVDAVIIGAPSALHAGLIAQAARAGKHIFCEKPAAHSLADLDTALDAVQAAGVLLQVGFNRRFARDFAEAGERVHSGGIGQVQLLRSLTRDPAVAGGLPNAAAIRRHVIFTETLIHDFDTLNWLNPGAQVTEVHVMADALVAPEHRENGLLDTAVVTLRYSNGAIGVAEANFSATYGYDVRGEVFGSEGMLQAGHPVQRTVTQFDAAGSHAPTERLNIELFAQAYREQLVVFVRKLAGIRAGSAEARLPVPTGRDARAALRVALAALESAETGLPVGLDAATRLAVAQ
ncbi:Gfo/Idh/MocA family oxidoreductase [Glutamicibacter sp. MNS18]|uniref:Gfo/Idh/MocA family oxidoreductase n=1 Tax=Glutamicibacter sp. MNS18 TaxID=2989817 RepID=UPI002235EE22|nr:Gfo/Idh/MocA family oxidoreductase [Glutamicibacter sp. MNS18]MCW4466375.1 Gfo/Idh/MocA family oxidoreductase [Glutamicibacter sp. MNS18]